MKSPGVWKICKIIYLADKEHLNRYGRFITGDQYSAMTKGPVPSQSYDLIKSTQNSFLDLDLPFKRNDNHRIQTDREADIDEFSKSDLIILDEVISKYGNMSRDQLSKIVHDDAWKEAAGANGEKVRKENGGTSSIPMPVESIIRLFENPEKITDYITSQGLAV